MTEPEVAPSLDPEFPARPAPSAEEEPTSVAGYPVTIDDTRTSAAANSSSLPPGNNSANAVKQQDLPNVSWEDIKSVQNLIERCLQKFMTQTEIIAALQVEANVDPSFTCLVWQKLEQQNPEFFFSYHARLKMRDQIVAFNYLVDQQVYLIRVASAGMMQPGMPPGMPQPQGMPQPPGMQMPPGLQPRIPPGMQMQPGMIPHHPLAQHPGFPQGMPVSRVPPGAPVPPEGPQAAAVGAPRFPGQDAPPPMSSAPAPAPTPVPASIPTAQASTAVDAAADATATERGSGATMHAPHHGNEMPNAPVISSAPASTLTPLSSAIPAAVDRPVPAAVVAAAASAAASAAAAVGDVGTNSHATTPLASVSPSNGARFGAVPESGDVAIVGARGNEGVLPELSSTAPSSSLPAEGMPLPESAMEQHPIGMEGIAESSTAPGTPGVSFVEQGVLATESGGASTVQAIAPVPVVVDSSAMDGTGLDGIGGGIKASAPPISTVRDGASVGMDVDVGDGEPDGDFIDVF